MLEATTVTADINKITLIGMEFLMSNASTVSAVGIFSLEKMHRQKVPYKYARTTF